MYVNAEEFSFLIGQTKEGALFQRLSRELLKTQTSFLQLAQAGIESTVKVGQLGSNVTIQVLNTEQQSTYTFGITADRGMVSPSTITKSIYKVGFITFVYAAPNNAALVGTTAAITITTSGVSYTFDILLLS